jgi:hypothetical protein
MVYMATPDCLQGTAPDFTLVWGQLVTLALAETYLSSPEAGGASLQFETGQQTLKHSVAILPGFLCSLLHKERLSGSTGGWQADFYPCLLRAFGE